MRSKGYFKYLGWVAAAAILAYLLMRVDLVSLWASIGNMKLSTAMALVATTTLANACQGLRFHWLWPEAKIPFRRQLGLPFCMHTANIILPLRIGESVRPLTLLRWNSKLTIKSILYWTVVDKLLEIVAFLSFVLVAAILFEQHVALAVTVFVLGHLGLAIFLKKTKVSLRKMILPYFASLLAWTFNGLFFYMLIEPLTAAFGLFMGTSLASSFPLAPGGVGTYEAAFVWISERFGLSANDAMARAVAAHSLSILGTLAIGIPLGAYWGWPKAKDAQTAQAPGLPFRFLFLNFFSYLMAAIVVLASGSFWIPDENMPKRKRSEVLGADG
ncbi:MAG: flippase-like domain-containing protein [Bdellovibrionales bacterium]|nr:flippase-like domain-containing protein [Bdellovibrionales bacterium]